MDNRYNYFKLNLPKLLRLPSFRQGISYVPADTEMEQLQAAQANNQLCKNQQRKCGTR